MTSTQLKGQEPGVVEEAEIVMRVPCTVRLGATMYFPHSIAVIASEPSAHKWFHDKYAGQRCTVTRITVKDVTLVPGVTPSKTEVRFDDKVGDGHVQKNVSPDCLIFVERAIGVYIE